MKKTFIVLVTWLAVFVLLPLILMLPISYFGGLLGPIEISGLIIIGIIAATWSATKVARTQE